MRSDKGCLIILVVLAWIAAYIDGLSMAVRWDIKELSVYWHVTKISAFWISVGYFIHLSTRLRGEE